MTNVTAPPPGRPQGASSVLALLPLPRPDSLTEQQVRGTACVWDGIPLAMGVAVDLGPRRMKRLDGHYPWFPRACPACVRAAAQQVHDHHSGTCEQCVDDPTQCDTRRALRRLALEGRP
ncbi:hypothetical protein [Streptomyces sp. TRM70350]|uniref:hypothetical protein n=1 Tax=Streptomyces sp. TRM70350 TaxID=2856165 RepID=UPI001C4841AA|nr:hypothetical protein [Streptomyces sp. TRM70350]MBV7697716.1 hypothetical protein [Streptomyces sp. TRM70350]